MPIYEYACANCGHQLEKLQKVSDTPFTTCPECHKDSLERLISAAGFRLKGGGWYETDFKSGSKRNLVASDSSSSDKKAETTSSSSSNDTKTEVSKGK